MFADIATQWFSQKPLCQSPSCLAGGIKSDSKRKSKDSAWSAVTQTFLTPSGLRSPSMAIEAYALRFAVTPHYCTSRVMLPSRTTQMNMGP